jgi:hypothetical protein
MPIPCVHPESVLLLTLDSCRYDTFAAADLPNLRRVGPLHAASAPSTFTFGSHMAMWVGFTPGVAGSAEPYVNPKLARVFKLAGGGAWMSGHEPFVRLEGSTIVDGFNRLGYHTIGSAAMQWFDPETDTANPLIRDFDTFAYASEGHEAEAQVAWVCAELDARTGPAFVFLNVGETHVPYVHAGAPWADEPAPCVPFGEHNDAAECRRRQTACLEWLDGVLSPLVEAFADANVILCGDHGDAWGEDGLWEHGIHHPKVIEVPLLLRLQHAPQPVAA